MLRKIRFIGSIAALYILTIGTLGIIAAASYLYEKPVYATAQRNYHPQVGKHYSKAISGKPIRIALPSAGIDLPLDDGIYDPQNQTWTLSDTRAQYALMSALANDRAGTTFIYGHGTDEVFGKIGSTHPPLGATAQLYTDNGHIFTYTLADIHDYTPADTSILNDTADGAPRLVVQTCTGAFSEWRTMFIFNFSKVESK